MKPLVSIITPSLNQGRFIRDTIESVAAQDYAPIEHIVVDGGSTDGTLEILKQYESQLTWISEPDDGQSDAINKGFAMANGEILTWLNSDDALMPGAVTAAAAEFVRDPELGLVYGDGYLTDEDGEQRVELLTPEPDLWLLQNVVCYILQPAAFFRRAALEDVGPLDKSLHWTMDWDLWLRLTRSHRSRHIRQFLATARFYPECKTASGGFARYREIVQMLRRNGGDRYSWAHAAYGVEPVLSVAERLWESAVGDGPGKAGSMQSRSLRAVSRFQGFVMTRLGHVWEDGWAGRRVCLQAPIGSHGLRLEGEVPPLPSLLRGQPLHIACDGEDIADVLLPPGRFCLEVPVNSDRGPLARVVLQAERTLSRSEVPRAERRRLAYRLTSIEPTPTSDALTVQAAPGTSGWYSDRWIGPQAVIWSRPPNGRITVTGSLPPSCPPLRGQQLKILWNGRLVHTARLRPGKFSCEFGVPGGNDGYGCLEISCKRSFVPHTAGINEDRRRIALMVDSVTGAAPPSA